MNDMIRIIKPSGGGKTTSLLKLAKEHGYILVEPTKMHADSIRKIAEIRDFQGIPIISFPQFLSDSQWSRAKYLIDELDCCLKFMGVCGYSNTELDEDGNEVRIDGQICGLPGEGRAWREQQQVLESNGSRRSL